ncbi:response regulator transcription factor [Streptomyces sp. 796.1]|uniref:helix-turn-helix transcriptional regulator n=1 Tax=Streptomyces sp. 796.1 TaxID=3163029 RepID=UPI0039C8EEE7
MNELREFVPAKVGAGHQPAGDDIAQELLAVRALVESTVMKHRDRQSRNSWVATIGCQENDILATAKKLFGEARESVDVVLAADSGPAQVLYSALDDWLSEQAVRATGGAARAAASRPDGAQDGTAEGAGDDAPGGTTAPQAVAESDAPSGAAPYAQDPYAQTQPAAAPYAGTPYPQTQPAPDAPAAPARGAGHGAGHGTGHGAGHGAGHNAAHGAAQRPVRTRLLCAQGALDRQFVQRHCGGPVPLEVRVARMPLLAAVVVDGRAALVCADAAAGRRASTIRDPGVIATLRTLFVGIWRKSLAAGERPDSSDQGRKEMLRQILEWMRLGVTDEVAARELSVSVRTYRRYVAEMMSLLGADSRFQAGVRAAELGLLPAAPVDGR